MGWGKLIPGRKLKRQSVYDAPSNPTYSPQPIEHRYSIDSGVDGRLNKNANPVMVQSFPILSNMGDTHRPVAPTNDIPRKAVPQAINPHMNVPQPSSLGDHQPPPEYTYPNAQNSDGHAQHLRSPYKQPANVPLIHKKVTIPVPDMAAASTTKQREGGSSKSRFFPSLAKTVANGVGAGSSANRPEVNVTEVDVRRCIKQLRVLYRLQLDIWSMKYVIDEDGQELLEKRTQAEAIQREIEHVLATWQNTTGANWGDAEMSQVDYCVHMYAMVAEKNNS